MKLCAKNNDNIDVYTVTPKSEKIKAYKRKILEAKQKILEISKFQTNDKNNSFICGNNKDEAHKSLVFSSKAIEADKEKVQYLFSNYLIDLTKGRIGSKFIAKEDIKRHIDFLTGYVNGTFDHIRPITIDCEKYYLVEPNMAEEMDYTTQKPLYVIRNIFTLPQELYHLQLLSSGKMYDLCPKDLDDELLSLYDFEQSNTHSISTIKDMIAEGIMIDFDETLKNAKKGADILKKAMKK